MTHDAVRDRAMVGLPDEQCSDRVAAVVLLQRAAKLASAEPVDRPRSTADTVRNTGSRDRLPI